MILCVGSHRKIEFFEQGIPSYGGIHDCVFLLCSVLGMSVESAPPISEEKEEEVEEKEKEEKEEDIPDDTTHSLSAEGSFMPFFRIVEWSSPFNMNIANASISHYQAVDFSSLN